MMEEKKGGGNWQERLLAWFDSHKRDLPWREDKPRNPYHVWISEIIFAADPDGSSEALFRQTGWSGFPPFPPWLGLRKARCSTSGRALVTTAAPEIS